VRASDSRGSTPDLRGRLRANRRGAFSLLLVLMLSALAMLGFVGWVAPARAVAAGTAHVQMLGCQR
jgi:hypothetical protein